MHSGGAGQPHGHTRCKEVGRGLKNVNRSQEEKKVDFQPEQSSAHLCSSQKTRSIAKLGGEFTFKRQTAFNGTITVFCTFV